ncbi:MAG TPA: dienelactone hydrolase family protein [Ktedonobacterales bacterium]|nr:dienelactone hydrolase family protein [Ktedonobacterales bacterium]
MCFSYDAMPPDLPPGVGASLPLEGADLGGASFGERTVLVSRDGTHFSAYVARPDAPSGAAIVILPDVRGLFAFYEQLAERFAVAGILAIAIDYFGRTAGLAPRDAEFEYMPHVMKCNDQQIREDVSAAITHLRNMPGAVIRAVYTVGFCFGGGNSFQQAANQHGLSGVIGFYGSPTRNRFGGPAPIERVRDFECPVLGLFGGVDQGISEEDVHAFDAALTNAGVEHEMVIYPGAPHSFFDRKSEEFQQESADAWNRMLTFIGAHTPRSTH